MVDMPLLPHHKRMLLEESAIDEKAIVERGYRSVESKAELKRLGFSTQQLITPTLLIPIFNVHGEIGLYHHRPDTPRIREGKPAKYEFPVRQKMVVDVHPSLRDRIRDPTIPLFITEGVKKADAAISKGLCCIAVVGTWNFSGTNEFGGLTSLPDWEGVAFKGRDARGNAVRRTVYVCYDSDVMLKPQVHQALCRLAEFVRSRRGD